MSQLPSSLQGLEYFTRDEVIAILNERVKDGTIKGYRFDGNDLFIEFIQPIERITLNFVLDKALLNGQQDS